MPQQTIRPGTVSSTLERVRRSGVIKVGFADEMPFSFRNKSTRVITGESWEIANHILKQMGVRAVEGVQTEFWSLIPKLLNRTYDMIAAGFYVTPVRFKEIIFSHPTYRNTESLVVKLGNPLGLKKYMDVVRHSFARVAVVFGSVASNHIRFYNLPPSRIIYFADGASALKGIIAGEADAFIASGLTLNDLMCRVGNNGLELVPEFDGFLVNGQPVIDYGAFGFRKDDRAFRDEFNSHLIPFVGTPAHLDLVRPFGFSEREMPGQLPADVLKLLV